MDDATENPTEENAKDTNAKDTAAAPDPVPDSSAAGQEPAVPTSVVGSAATPASVSAPTPPKSEEDVAQEKGTAHEKDATKTMNELLEMLFKAANVADRDPQSRGKLHRLDRSTQKAYDSNRPNASDYLMQKYQHSKGLKKLVDGGLDFAEKIAKAYAPKEQHSEIDKGFGQAREFLAGLKKPSPRTQQPSAEVDENSPSSALKPTPAPGQSADLTPTPAPGQSADLTPATPDTELTPPLHKVLDIYQKLVKLMLQLLKGQKPEMDAGGATLDQETMNQTLGQMKNLYQNSPTLQKMVDVGLKFAEKIALKLAPDENAQDIKKGFADAKEIFKVWKNEAQQKRQAERNVDPLAEPVSVERPPLQEGGVEPVSAKPAPKAGASTAPRPKPPGGGVFSSFRTDRDKEEEKSAQEALARQKAKERQAGGLETPVAKPIDQA